MVRSRGDDGRNDRRWRCGSEYRRNDERHDGRLGRADAHDGAPVPPPVPRSLYYVAVNGAATGPFDMAVLKQMVAAGEFTRDSLVWKPGMAEWQASGACSELGTLFAEGVSVSGMPPVPKHG